MNWGLFPGKLTAASDSLSRLVWLWEFMFSSFTEHGGKPLIMLRRKPGQMMPLRL
jgi:hypothetical protein